MSCQLLTRFRHITSLFLATFVWTPAVKPARLNGCPGSFERDYYLLCSAKVLWKNCEPFLKNITSNSDFAISHLYFSLRLYERQSVKPARLNGCPGSFERDYYLLCSAKVLWENFEPFLKNRTSNLVVSCQLLTRFRHITSLFLATFVWTPVCQTSAAKWLLRLIWKGISSTMFSESIVKKLRAVFEKYNIKLSCVMSPSDQISPYHIFISRYVCMNASLSNQRG